MNPHSFLQPHSRVIRLWHWTFFLCISATIIIVLLASTIFRTRDNISVVQEQLQQKGVTVTSDQARAVAHEFSDKLWDLHRLIGFVLSGLLLTRLFIEIYQPREEKLRNRLKKAMGFRSTIPIEQIENRHYIGVKITYLIFYALFLLMALTGLVLAFEDIPFLKEFHQPAKQIHSILQYFIYAFILIHLIGVIRADLGHHKGLVSGMIHGEKIS
jgi:Ni/Fe-hydrogenase 1 B-type cytochrome subunit